MGKSRTPCDCDLWLVWESTYVCHIKYSCLPTLSVNCWRWHSFFCGSWCSAFPSFVEHWKLIALCRIILSQDSWLVETLSLVAFFLCITIRKCQIWIAHINLDRCSVMGMNVLILCNFAIHWIIFLPEIKGNGVKKSLCIWRYRSE